MDLQYTSDIEGTVTQRTIGQQMDGLAAVFFTERCPAPVAPHLARGPSLLRARCLGWARLGRMPELPDIVVVVERLGLLLEGARCGGLRLGSPFVLRTVEPPSSALLGAHVTSVERVGKRVVVGFDNDVYAVFHLMISGRFQWRAPSAPVPGRIGVLALDFEHGTLTMTEASPKKRASLHLVVGRDGVAGHDPGGVDVFAIDDAAFIAALRRERHTLKRTLTDPRTFSGIGNAYSDEILHDAQLSPTRMSDALDDDAARRLLASTRRVLARFTDILRRDKSTPLGPDKMTAFRPEMAVHGKAGQPCPRCGDPVQRIATADTETNYCATCQTGGKLLKDRALSRLLKDDFPKTLDELELMKRGHRGDDDAVAAVVDTDDEEAADGDAPPRPNRRAKR